MSKLSLTTIANLLGNPTSAATSINNNSALTIAAVDNTLSRDGSSPNEMNSDFDMNSHDILNVDNVFANALFANALFVNGSPLTGETGGWLTGAGVPSPTLGLPKDMYLDTASGNVYGPKTDVWGAPVGNIKGPAGPSGAGTGDMLRSNNLSDLNDLATGRKNLVTPTFVTSIAALQALDTTKDTVVHLSLSGRSGLFYWRTGDYSSQLTIDTVGGVYIKANSIAATSGAWVRSLGIGDEVNTAWFGSTGNGSTDDTLPLQIATQLFLRVYIPAGLYKLTAGLQGLPNCTIRGGGLLRTRLQRNGNWAGDTIRVGLPDGTVSAGTCQISDMLLEQLHPGFVVGTSNTMVDRLTGGQSQVAIYGGYKALISRVWTQNGAYGIKFVGCVGSVISDCHGYGIWDNKVPAIQEMLAWIWIGENQAIAAHQYNTEIRIERCYGAGAGPSAQRTITVGSKSYSDYENIGSQFGIYVTGCEGLEIVNGYLGGSGQDNIAIHPFGLTTMINIDGMFLDECYGCAIRIYGHTSSKIVTNVTVGAGVRQNSQLKTRSGIRVDNPGGWWACDNLSVLGGVWANNLECAFYLLGLNGGYFAPGIVSAYNSKVDTSGSASVCSGMYVGQVSRNIRINGGLWGGDVDVMQATGGSKYAVYTENSSYIIASNVYAINGLSGGGTIGGGSQVYPA